MTRSLGREAAAEALGAGLLLAVVVGSGIMAERLFEGDDGLALLANAAATGAILPVLITMFAPLSGAHFNPAVTLVLMARREITAGRALIYAGAQVVGAVGGVWVAHAMFGEAVLQTSTTVRPGAGQGLSELVATFGLIGVILATRKARPDFVAGAVGLYVASAYWFTASTAFANPAVTLARMFTDTFAGIDPASAPLFVLAQAVGALAALGAFGWLLEEKPV